MADKEMDELEKVNEALTSSEKFIEKHQKTIITVVIAIVVIVSAVLAVRHFYLIPREEKAQVAMYRAVLAFEQDSLDLALNGNADFDGFLFVIDQYGSTQAGNLACAYAGLVYYEKGEYETALEYLSKFSAGDAVVSPAIVASIGNCYASLEKYAEAVKCFEKAAQATDNDVFSPIYLMKAAAVYEKMGQKADALKLYEKIKSEYPRSQQAQTIDSYIERAKLQ